MGFTDRLRLSAFELDGLHRPSKALGLRVGWALEPIQLSVKVFHRIEPNIKLLQNLDSVIKIKRMLLINQ
jgi:hypothetical protein